MAACLLGACSPGPGQALKVATGAVTRFVCSQTFVSGEQPGRIYAETFQPIAGSWAIGWGLRYDVDRARGEVSTSFLGAFTSRAVYRPGIGCTILAEGAPLPADAVPHFAPVVADLPPIAGPAVVEPADPRLKAALDREFAEPAGGPLRRTKAVVVVHDGRVIAERYAPGYGIDTPLIGNSLTKSVVNALVGILVREGRLAVDRPAPVPAWRDPGDPRHGITLDQLLRMQSGLDLGNSLEANLASLWNPSNRMLFIERDMAGFAERAALAAKPGTHWNYADGSYLIASRIIRDAVGGGMADVLGFVHRELFAPLGIRTATIEFDATGTPVGSAAMLASARDWARFGLLYLGDGMAGGRRILPPGWVEYAAQPTEGAWVGYGAGFWTNRDHSFGAERRLALGMPRDVFFGRGKFGQYVIVVPSARLVIVRLGTAHGDLEDIDGVSRLTAAVIAIVQEKSAAATAPRP
ncbi:MAG TPA: serine hydrolase [Candidatus Sulfotelmatobacter sp.]|nr:serine hydrolase [Candidatus Sulfotelmatobacter sp.]